MNVNWVLDLSAYTKRGTSNPGFPQEYGIVSIVRRSYLFMYQRTESMYRNGQLILPHQGCHGKWWQAQRMHNLLVQVNSQVYDVQPVGRCLGLWDIHLLFEFHSCSFRKDYGTEVHSNAQLLISYNILVSLDAFCIYLPQQFHLFLQWLY